MTTIELSLYFCIGAVACRSECDDERRVGECWFWCLDSIIIDINTQRILKRENRDVCVGGILECLKSAVLPFFVGAQFGTGKIHWPNCCRKVLQI